MDLLERLVINVKFLFNIDDIISFTKTHIYLLGLSQQWLIAHLNLTPFAFW